MIKSMLAKFVQISFALVLILNNTKKNSPFLLLIKIAKIIIVLYTINFLILKK
jgi:hypothetical protein